MAKELDAENAAEWLSEHGFPCPGRCTELGGGVSNRVIMAETGRGRVVVKQSLGKLRVEQEWLSDRRRIFREADVMRWLAARSGPEIVRGGRIPGLLLESPADFAIVMECAPAGAEMWKTRLFAADLDSTCAQTAGRILGSVIAASWRDPEAERRFGDQTVFEQLRLDPYYRFTAARHPEHSRYFQSLLARTADRRVSLVHGDWSPKNLLVTGKALWAIDWEVVHFGDPGFDVGFLLNHLLLKSIAMPTLRLGFEQLAVAFESGLRAALPREALWAVESGLEHLPALLLARVDGKSPAGYLDDAMRHQACQLAFHMMDNPPKSVSDIFSVLSGGGVPR